MIVLKVVFEVETMNADLYEQRVEMMMRAIWAHLRTKVTKR